MSFFTLKLNSVWIDKNREVGGAEINIFSLVLDNNLQFDFLGQLKDPITEAKKTELIKLAANQILGYKQFIEIDHIKDNQRITFGPTGVSLFTGRQILESFDWNFLIMENDQKIRDFGKQLSNLFDGPGFDKLSSSVISLVTTAVNPVAVASAEIVKICGKTISALMQMNSNDQICAFCESFNVYEDYPNLNAKFSEVEDLSGNCRLNYSIFGVR